MKGILVAMVMMALAMAAAPAMANPNVGVETDVSKKIGDDTTDSIKDTDEKSESASDKKSTSASTGEDKQWQDAVRNIMQESNNTSADMSMPLETLFQGQILRLEKTTEPFISCKLMSKPKQARDYGITAMVGSSDVDTYKSQALSALASSNGPVDDFANLAMLSTAKRCMAYYGGIIAQAYLNTETSIAALTIKPDVQPELEATKSVAKNKNANKKGKNAKVENKKPNTEVVAPGLTVGVVADKSGGKRISGIGRDDYIALATEALNKALKDGMTDERIIGRFNEIIAEDDVKCTFAGATDRILCGSSLMVLGPKQQLFAAGDIEVYGHSFMGLQGAYRISKSWSLSKAFEKMASTSKYERQMKEISRAIEKMEREGHALEASIAKRTAIEQSMSGRKSLDLSGIIPGLKGQ